jgi:CDP-paratose 2-epimerase
LNVLEYAKQHRAGVILLSSSRVYSIPALCALPLKIEDGAYTLQTAGALPVGASEEGIDAGFSTAPPISLYGATKLASEAVALEYGHAFGFPVWVNRCGVLAGAGQFGTPDQGIFSYWIHAHRARRPLRYIGFDGAGKQVRDALHPRDLAALLDSEMHCSRDGGQRLYTAGGGRHNAISLANLNAWCDTRFGTHRPESDRRPRTYDIPWLIMDSRDSQRDWRWSPEMALEDIFNEIAGHAESHPDWLERSGL